ncbi:LLM class F420-dependent oxidoreductase [Actinomadura madurae]|uniref:LLM class F420-dependent oxidoreductase n=1 Tax=Actinomadura madurae TaxID=1993 RepID=UPI002025FFBA|nr:LLM class F420-dependent oxidoreductase [Actinomadura madurae]MCP9948251.1 LLM class F420-dependent oxidoreductase [Actinomadura madurae]MCP9965019.1 LLM class F420-dependent oxidoreductase [Actinomadura madurae]MCP9977514.1 LLM class F420-dependent oxidoreductase [Actinomadura madurae]MCQ0010988.1 LLM class F420-dependent oxidoreductase [Actinomadura madurae]MCQ0013696.1 LLM class F420-dependent oxidoreductase [Actinomadura madurae]
MQFGLNIVPVHPGELSKVAIRAEELGFESLWSGEHVVTPTVLRHSYPGRTSKPPFAWNSRFLDPLATLTFLAGITSRVRLGTGVLIMPLHDPATLARAITTVDVLSGGRLSLGIGVGWMREEFDATGQEFRNRGRRTDEMIMLLDTLFSEETPSFAGEFYSMPEVGFEPKPVQKPRPPLLIGGRAPAALRRAARDGDGWYGSLESPDEIRSILAAVHTMRAEHGRADLPFEVTAIMGWGKGYDRELVESYAAAGVDRLVVTPWTRSRQAMEAIERFAADAGLEAR